jgi:hypothetical protein
MDFLIEPLIETNESDLIVDPVSKPCCSSGSGCGSGMAQSAELDEV